MKRIPLTQGQFAIVDDEDYEELSKHNWYAVWCPNTKSYYAARTIRLPNGKRVMEIMHRRILGLEYGDKLQGDHLNHATLDNQRMNLRIVNNRQNSHNQRCRGYYWHKCHHKYKAQIRVDGDCKHLGFYDDPAEARAAYLEAKNIYHPTAPIPTETGGSRC